MAAPIARHIAGNLTLADLADLKQAALASEFEDRKAIADLAEDAANRIVGYSRAAGEEMFALVAVIDHGRLLEIRPAAEAA